MRILFVFLSLLIVSSAQGYAYPSGAQPDNAKDDSQLACTGTHPDDVSGKYVFMRSDSTISFCMELDGSGRLSIRSIGGSLLNCGHWDVVDGGMLMLNSVGEMLEVDAFYVIGESNSTLLFLERVNDDLLRYATDMSVRLNFGGTEKVYKTGGDGCVIPDSHELVTSFSIENWEGVSNLSYSVPQGKNPNVFIVKVSIPYQFKNTKFQKQPGDRYIWTTDDPLYKALKVVKLHF